MASISLSGRLRRSTSSGFSTPPPGRLKAANDQAKVSISLIELRRYSFIGRRTSSRTAPSSSPTNVCSMSVTLPVAGSWPAAARAWR